MLVVFMTSSCAMLKAPEKQHINAPVCTPNFDSSTMECTDNDSVFVRKPVDSEIPSADNFFCFSPNYAPDILR